MKSLVDKPWEPSCKLIRTAALIGFAVAGVRCNPSLYERLREFSDLFPFLRFSQPIFHFFLGKRSARTAHEFERRKLFMRIHENSPK